MMRRIPTSQLAAHYNSQIGKYGTVYNCIYSGSGFEIAGAAKSVKALRKA